MAGIFDTLFLNFCMVVALSYLLSLTYTDWKIREDSWKVKLLRATLAAGCSIVLMFHGFQYQGYSISDLRLVPILLITLRYGWFYGLLSTLPVVAVRLIFLGHLPSELFLIGMGFFWLTLLPLARKVPQDVKPYLTISTLALVGYHLVWLLSEQRAALFTYFFVPSLLFNVLGFAVAMMVIRTRILYLKATQELRTQSQTDALTGTLNRRQFEADLGGFQSGDVFMVLDLDHFKQVNDTHGHHMGDQVLKDFSSILRSSTRNWDRVYRLGGEEFLVVLRGTSAIMAARIAERIRFAVEHHDFEVGSLTVSGGWCPLGPDMTPDMALHQADQLLYTAKFAGRNQMRSPLEQSSAS
ncbi:GGDEF domain-containing protein [Deinococcus roseus]|uniref:GGDEF domain-containing protein n=1 Tax=Deinococcus roseus TaxID=392414 RepID=A0ABQ2DI84_9DEIO|nr:diguanylate cyclase [Deinococcus roseus]GGJ58528.1 GGDEF domain-containing protein [Deinococcus roseus]